MYFLFASDLNLSQIQPSSIYALYLYTRSKLGEVGKYLFIYSLKSNWRSNLYNHRIYKYVLVQQDLEGREHLI